MLLNHYPHSDIINYSDFDIFEGRHIMEKFKDFGDVLAKARKQKHLKQSELATLLNERGVSVTNQAISKWETGKVVPNAIQFLALCDIYGIDDALYFFSNGQAGKGSGHTGDVYDEVLSGLNKKGRKMAIEMIHALSESSKYAQKT